MRELIVGFTGSRAGLTPVQKLRLAAHMGARSYTHAVHGDCIGADAEFHALCKFLGITTSLRPCNLKAQRAYCNPIGNEAWIAAPQKPLVRNKQIVNDVDHMIAFPSTEDEVWRSGTWSTVRYSRKVRRPGFHLWVYLPQGNLVYTNSERAA